MTAMSGIFPDTDLYALLTNLRRALKDKGKVAFAIRNVHRTGIPNTGR